MAKKILTKHKVLHELMIDCRIKRKKLSKKLRISQQLLTYIIDRLKLTGVIIGEKTVVDPARLGLTNMVVFYTYTEFKKKQEIIDYLKECDSVTNIIRIGHGADLMVEYSVLNISFFNKTNNDFIEKFRNSIKVVDIYPVIVKHHYSPKFLYKKSNITKHIILSGDREPVTLKINATKVLECLIRTPSASILSIAKEAKLNTRTVNKTLKMLIDERIITGFTIIVNHRKIQISRCKLMVNMTDINQKEINRLLMYSQSIPEITSVIKLLGKYSFLFTIESLDSYNRVVDALREEFNLVDYTIYEKRGIIKDKSIPTEVL